MASSNRHWPSMFKSKPSNSTTHNQWQHDLNSTHMSPGCHRNPYTPGFDEERTPEPKPRWNPRPEQIRILEAIFNSGMVNPQRDEIRRIRAQLQEYGQVGDANVFYWFQNRKSRSKNKQRHLQNTKPLQSPQTRQPPPMITSAYATVVPAPASSSSSSDKSSTSPNSNKMKAISVSQSTLMDLLNSPTASVNQPFLQAASSQFLNEPFLNSSALTQGFGFPEFSCVAEETEGNCPNVLLSDQLMLMNHGPMKKDEDEKMKLQQQHLSYTVTAAPNTADPIDPQSFSLPSPTNHFLQAPGLGETAPQKMTVFINDVCFEVATAPFNVREAFGDDAVLIQSSGQPVVTNEWGVTQQPLQHGAFYYLVRAFAPLPDDRTIDLI